jgi:hypothetical protein
MRAARDEGDVGPRLGQRRTKPASNASGADNRNTHEFSSIDQRPARSQSANKRQRNAPLTEYKRWRERLDCVTGKSLICLSSPVCKNIFISF